jgi:hypothetical protein
LPRAVASARITAAAGYASWRHRGQDRMSSGYFVRFAVGALVVAATGVVLSACATKEPVAPASPSGSAPSVASPSPSASPPPIASPSPAASPSPSAQEELETYLASKLSVDRKVGSAMRRAGKRISNSRFSYNRDSSWVAFEANLREYAQLSVSAAGDYAVIEPPPSLGKAHAALVRAYRLGGKVAEDLADAVAKGSTVDDVRAEWASYKRTQRRTRDLFDAWAFAVRAEAKRLGVAVQEDWFQSG